MNKRNETLFFLLVIALFEVFLLALFNLTYLIGDLGVFNVGNLRNFSWPISLFLIVLTGYTIILTHRVFRQSHKEVEAQAHFENLQHILQLVDTIRLQRHDFMHHVQTVHGLLEIGEFAEAREYLRDRFGSLVVHEELTKIRHPGILALLLTKIAQAETRSIELDISADTDLVGLSLPVSQVNIIIGNILDNALDAVITLESEEKRVYLDIEENSETYQFTLRNYGPPIDGAIIKRIFDCGFTTKKGGQGLGLYSVKQSVERLKGTIEVSSDEIKGTVFKVTLPKGGR
ncbi:GHKL domain-containing protein [Thermanaerosceptrum fracticalcis]|uniref:histidine kinase n=1 Tax=Thermanaerosceptrum fracticalcis TaxID=1712410 RepID=A0A7G6DYJ2_THEFR|nr:ATP-binding protein [Thermanaerosceptrum fracticalcis]QNB44896.1 GHKL domain-containing protein [Thermanaerosceptrum fracticalcis]